jgi:hypothetical protein
MRFILQAASGKYHASMTVEVSTLEQLMDLVRKEKSDIIVSVGQEREGNNPPIEPSLMVYDDYIE